MLRLLVCMLSTAGFLLAEFTVNPVRESGVYDEGEEISWVITWTGEDPVPTEVTYVFKLGGYTESTTGSLELEDGVGHLSSTIDTPNTVLLVVTWTEDGEERTAEGGAVAAPERIQPSAPAPEDFDEFWAAKIAELNAAPMNPRLQAQSLEVADVDYWQLNLDGFRGSQIRGQLARPQEGEKFPALLIVQWAGVYGLKTDWVTSRAQQGWLALNILPHDLPIDQPEAFYAEQKEGPLKDYFSIGNDDRETSYFLRMYLSCYRAVEYLRSRPDWDGTTLVVMGTSQGGQQTLVTAGLQPDITAALALVPAGNDMLAPAAGRLAAFPYWYWNVGDKDAAAVREASRYFDAVNFAPRIKAPLLVGVGLRDLSCPPAGIFAAANQVQGPKEVMVLRDSAHQNYNGAQDVYTRRAEDVWLPALRQGLAAPVAETD